MLPWPGLAVLFFAPLAASAGVGFAFLKAGSSSEKDSHAASSRVTISEPICFCTLTLAYISAYDAGRCAVAAAGFEPIREDTCPELINAFHGAQRPTWRCQTWS